MSAAVHTIHADRPPVVQTPRRGRLPRCIGSLRDAQRRRQRSATERKRVELHERVADCMRSIADLELRLARSDADLAAEQRRAAVQVIEAMQVLIARARAELAVIAASGWSAAGLTST